MENKYAEFDSRLIARIEAGENKMILLDNQEMRALAKPFCIKDRYGNMTPEFRIIDRRLQALRKAGKILFQGGRWSISV